MSRTETDDIYKHIYLNMKVGTKYVQVIISF
jgi:hypothetical protein